MKKLVLALAVIGAAIASQAAAVSWSATSVKDITGASAKNVTGWSVVCTIYAADGTTVVGTSMDDASNAMSKFNGTIDGTANNATYYAQLVFTDAAGNTLTSDKAMFTTDSSATYGEINFTTGAKFAEATAKVDYAGGWVAAPEPTSGLLLLLGVAGLALRRKQA